KKRPRWPRSSRTRRTRPVSGASKEDDSQGMGKLTGFMEYARLQPPGRDPKARVRDWLEFHDHLPESTLKEQGARCMDCGVPFCHTGTLLAGGASGCPINNLIP